MRHVGVTVVNLDNSPLARDIISNLASTPFFSVDMARTYADAIESVAHGYTDVVLEIPYGFQKDMDNGESVRPHISANGVNGIKGSLGAQYVSRAVTKSIAAAKGVDVAAPVTVEYLYNPTLEYRNNMIPALMIMLIIMICGFMPALNMVAEKESGTIEQMNVSPVKTWIFVLSKVIPYWLIGVVDLALAMVIAYLVYGLSPSGSILTIYIAVQLFIFTMSGIGLIIANGSARMSQSMFMMFFIIMVFVLMSGLFTPVTSMPRWAQCITYALPPRYFIEIMRSVYLKATAFSELGLQFAALGAFAILTNAVAALTYRKRR